MKKIYTLALILSISTWSMAQCPPGILPYLTSKNITVCPGQTTVNLAIIAGNLSAYKIEWDAPALAATSGWIPANGNPFQAQVLIPTGTGASAPVTIKGVFRMSYPGGGCESVDTIRLKVGYPSISAISPVVCSGTSATSISFSPAGSITPDSYATAWSNDAFQAGLRNSSGTLTGSSFPVSTFSGLPTAAGTYSGSLYVVGNSAYQSSPNCTSPAIAISVTVRAAPTAAVTGSSNVCPGAATSLTASSASTYLWSTNATTQSINATAGSYSVTVTDAYGCSATSSSFSVGTLTPTASISASRSVICAAGPTILTANSGSSYLWSTGASTQAISVSTPGVYTVTVTNSIGCNQTSAGLNLAADYSQGVIYRSGDLCIAGAETLMAGSGSNYSWGSQFQTVYVAGHYAVTYNTVLGCPVQGDIEIACGGGSGGGGGDDFRKSLADRDAPDENIDPLAGKFSVYPNPANGELRLHLPKPVVELVEVRLIDMLGIVHIQASMRKDEVEKVISTQGLLPGMYLLQIQGEKMNRVKNVVVMH